MTIRPLPLDRELSGTPATDADVAHWFRGDPREYPERLWPWALALRDEWKFTLPTKPRKRADKSKYGFWILAMDDLKTAAAEFGLKALRELRTDFTDYMAKHQGLAPYTVAGPQSLINVMNAKVALMRSKEKPAPKNPFLRLERFLDE